MTVLRIPMSPQQPLGYFVNEETKEEVYVYPTIPYYKYWNQVSQDALGGSTTSVSDTATESVQRSVAITRQFGKMAYHNVVSLNLPVRHEPNGYTITVDPAGTIFSNGSGD